MTLLWWTNRKSHMPVIDLRRIWTVISSNFLGILRYFAFRETSTAKRMQIDPYYRRQKCCPMTLVSGNVRPVRIFAGVPLGGGVKWQWGCRPRQFLAIWLATSSESWTETLEIRPAILHGDMLPLLGLYIIDYNIHEWPRMTLSGYFMSKSVFGQQGCRALTVALARLSC